MDRFDLMRLCRLLRARLHGKPHFLLELIISDGDGHVAPGPHPRFRVCMDGTLEPENWL